MAGNRQLENLCSVYAEKSEPELLALYEQREDLTDLAQEALAQVMHERHIAAPGAASSAITAPGSALEPATDATSEATSIAPTPDEVCVFTFSDAFQLSEALRLLNQQQILCRMVNWDEIRPRDEDGPMRLGLIVAKTDAAQARKCLQDGMNLFPPSEGGDGFDQLTGLMLVGMFARADALLVAHGLGSQAVSYLWSEDPEGQSDDVQIEVQGTQLEQAHEIAERVLAAADAE